SASRRYLADNRISRYLNAACALCPTPSASVGGPTLRPAATRPTARHPQCLAPQDGQPARPTAPRSHPPSSSAPAPRRGRSGSARGLASDTLLGPTPAGHRPLRRLSSQQRTPHPRRPPPPPQSCGSAARQPAPPRSANTLPPPAPPYAPAGLRCAAASLL